MRFFRGNVGSASSRLRNKSKTRQVSKALLSERGVITARLDQQVELQRLYDKPLHLFGAPQLSDAVKRCALSAFLFISGRKRWRLSFYVRS